MIQFFYRESRQDASHENSSNPKHQSYARLNQLESNCEFHEIFFSLSCCCGNRFKNSALQVTQDYSSITNTDRSPISAHTIPIANLLQPTNTVRPRMARDHIFVLSNYSNPTVSSRGTAGQKTTHTTTDQLRPMSGTRSHLYVLFKSINFLIAHILMQTLYHQCQT